MSENTFGFSEQQWSDAKKQAIQTLIERARVEGTISYSDLVKRIKTVQLEAHDIRLDHLLGAISEAEDAAGRGMLSVIVVHKDGDMHPGRGFFELANKLGRDTTDVVSCWVRELKKVYSCWKVN